MRYYWVSETCEGAKLISKVHRSWLQRVAASNTSAQKVTFAGSACYDGEVQELSCKHISRPTVCLQRRQLLCACSGLCRWLFGSQRSCETLPSGHALSLHRRQLTCLCPASACVQPVMHTPQQYMGPIGAPYDTPIRPLKRSKYDKAIEVRSPAIGAQKIWTETMML